MKKTIIALALWPIFIKAQKADSLIRYDNEQITYMKKCFAAYHRQYITGNIISGVGLVGSAAILATASNKTNAQSANNTNTLVGVTGLIALVGVVVTIDASKWINRASFGITQNGVGMTYQFK